MLQICGYMVPKGTPVMFAVWALHHNKHVWGEDALTWRPDRWLEGKSVAAAKKDAAGQLRFLPFLDGPSNCIGQNLALVRRGECMAVRHGRTPCMDGRPPRFG